MAEKINISRKCPNCGKEWSVDVYVEDFEKFARGEGLVQEIFPYLSADDREFFISGICPKCWDMIFVPED